MKKIRRDRGDSRRAFSRVAWWSVLAGSSRGSGGKNCASTAEELPSSRTAEGVLFARPSQCYEPESFVGHAGRDHLAPHAPKSLRLVRVESSALLPQCLRSSSHQNRAISPPRQTTTRPRECPPRMPASAADSFTCCSAVNNREPWSDGRCHGAEPPGPCELLPRPPRLPVTYSQGRERFWGALSETISPSAPQQMQQQYPRRSGRSA